jgi:hypothetical protein
MKTKKPKLYKNPHIRFIYGFVDIQSTEELLEWKKLINNFDRTHEVTNNGIKNTYENPIIIVLNQNSMGFNEISELRCLCLKLTEEKYNSTKLKNQFIKVLDSSIWDVFTGDPIETIASMSCANNYFDYVYEEISLIDYKNSSVDIVSETMDRMIQTIHQPKNIYSSIIVSKEANNPEVGEIVRNKGFYDIGFNPKKKNYLEIYLLGTDFD